ncbi:MAG: hypothetical protein AAGC95_07290, partial [Pseudomonadota bacterium]
NQFGGLLGIGESTNIRIEDSKDLIGVIDAPGLFRGNVSDLDYRIQIANNAFEWMLVNIHSDSSNTARHQEILGRLHDGKLPSFP